MSTPQKEINDFPGISSFFLVGAPFFAKKNTRKKSTLISSLNSAMAKL